MNGRFPPTYRLLAGACFFRVALLAGAVVTFQRLLSVSRLHPPIEAHRISGYEHRQRHEFPRWIRRQQ
jgi:hypothetical protein